MRFPQLPDFLASPEQVSSAAPLLLRCFGEPHRPNHAALWEGLLALLRVAASQLWRPEAGVREHMNKAVWPLLWKVLETGGYGSHALVFTQVCLVPLSAR